MMGFEGDGEKAVPNTTGRRLIVGMKLTSECRELLTWALAKLAQAGDQVLALHVALSPTTEMSRADVEVHKFQLASTFCNVLSVYEGLCSMRQVDLQVKIVNGMKVRTALLDEVKLHDASVLVLGPSKRSSTGQAAAFGKHCVKRLPQTWSVLVVERGRIIFSRQGTLSVPSGTGPEKAGVLQVLHRSLKRVGSRAPRIDRPKIFQSPSQSEDQLESSPSDSSFSGSLGSFSGSAQSCDAPDSPVSVLPSPKPRPFDSFRLSASKRRVEGSLYVRVNSAHPSQSQVGYGDATLGDGVCDVNGTIATTTRPSVNVHPANREAAVRGSDAASTPSPSEDAAGPQRLCFSPTDDRASCPAELDQDQVIEQKEQQDDFQVGWPLRHRHISSRTLSTPQEAARSLSVVRWALQLPSRARLASHHSKSSAVQSGYEELEPARHSLSSLPATDHSMSGLAPINGFQSFGGSATTPSRESESHLRRRKSPLSFPLAQELLSIELKCRLFSFEELEQATHFFSEGNLVGEGGCSRVYHGILPDGLSVAVKSLYQDRPEALQELLTEIEIISSLKHPQIVAFIGYCADGQNLVLVYNFVARGNLEENLHGQDDGWHCHAEKHAAQLSSECELCITSSHSCFDNNRIHVAGDRSKPVLEWNVRQKVAAGTAAALQYLHSECPRRVFHRDVKASNILLSADFEPQISDFGLAKWAPNDASYITCNDVVGTFGYLAPEYFMYGKVDEKTDVYSFGVVLLELITGRQPIDSTRPKGEENLAKWARPFLDDVAADKLVDPRLEGRYIGREMSQMVFAASLCLRQSPDNRPKMSTVHKILSGDTGSLRRCWLKEEPDPSPAIEDESQEHHPGNSDLQTHMALAMLGVDDNDDTFSEDLAHTNKSLEEYMNGRYSRSSSFN